MVDPGSGDDVRVGPNGVSEREVRPYRTVLVVGPPGTLSPSLIYAIEREFPWVRVEHRQEVAALDAGFACPVSLILVDAPFLMEAEALAPAIARRHPHAVVACLEKAGHQPAHCVLDLAKSSLVRSVLPMDLSLDIWLSIVRLLLCGGDYMPMHMIQSQRGGTADGSGPFEGGGVQFEELTPRESEVLELVARGLQNKSIAGLLSLSENTVKIHLHNIISKLGVHNRTEAAARFRDRRAGIAGPEPDFRRH